MNRILLTSIFLLVSVVAFAQGSDEDSKIEILNNEFGFNVGATTGVGFSYRHWGDRFGFQVTALPYKVEEDQFISAAITGMFSLRKTKYIRTFLYWGNHVFSDTKYSDYSEYDSETDSYIYYSQNEVRTQFNSGFGIGFSFGRIVAFNVSVGYGAYDIFGGSDNFSLMPTGEIGLYWKF